MSAAIIFGTDPAATALRPASISAGPWRAARSAALSAGALRPGGESLDHRAHVVHVLDLVRVQRRHFQPAPRRVAQHALLAQQQQRLLHRLPRHAQRLRDLLLHDALARRQAAGVDLGEHRVVHLLGQVGGQGEGLHRGARAGLDSRQSSPCVRG